MVSDNCSSIWCPWVEISSGITYMCVTIGYADANAMSTRTTAKNLPMAPHLHSEFSATVFVRIASKRIPVRLVEGSDGVLARRQIGQLEATVFSGNRIVRIFEHSERPVHPGMDVALHRDELGLVVLVDNGRRTWGLRLVPLVVDFCQRVNVVGGLIFIQDLEFLIDLKREDMRQIAAALLRENCCLRRRRLIWGSRRNVHHHIFQRVVGTGYHGFRRRRRRILLRAAGLLRHVDGLLLCRCPFVGHLAAHGAAARYGGGHRGCSKYGHSCQKDMLRSHPLAPPEFRFY